jgi:hypothetical protein
MIASGGDEVGSALCRTGGSNITEATAVLFVCVRISRYLAAQVEKVLGSHCLGTPSSLDGVGWAVRKLVVGHGAGGSRPEPLFSEGLHGAVVGAPPWLEPRSPLNHVGQLLALESVAGEVYDRVGTTYSYIHAHNMG